jgi:hypothetical protein
MIDNIGVYVILNVILVTFLVLLMLAGLISTFIFKFSIFEFSFPT